MPRNYPAGGNYRGQYGSQQSSRRGGYQSLYTPIPIEFLQEQLRGRQQDYDVTFAGAVASKERMAQEQAALQDLGSKNQLIDETMGNINKTVEEKYGGDWSRASKEIASMVSSARQNPFWETTKHLKAQQELQQKYQLEHPDAHIYQDVMGQTSIDPMTGKVRSGETLTFRGGARGDWAGSVAKQFSGMTGDRLVSTLKNIGIEGYAGIKSIEELSDDDLQAFAGNSAVVETFKENNPDFYKSKSEIEGLTDAEIDAEAADYIYGQVAPRAYRKETLQPVKDQAYLDRLKAAGTKNPYYAVSRKLPIAATAPTEIKNQEALLRGITFDENGNANVDITTRIVPTTPGPHYYEREAADNANRIQAVNDYAVNLVEQYPQLADVEAERGIQGVMEEYKAYIQWVGEESNTAIEMRLDQSSENLLQNVVGQINSTNFEGATFVSTGDVFGKKSITDELGFKNYQEFQTAMEETDYGVAINFRNGKALVTLPRKTGKNKYEPVEVYFDLNQESQDVMYAGQTLTEQYYDTDSYGQDAQEIRIPDGKGGFTTGSFFTQGEGDMLNRNRKDGKYNKTVYYVDTSDPDAVPVAWSLEKAQTYLAGIIDKEANLRRGPTGNIKFK